MRLRQATTKHKYDIMPSQIAILQNKYRKVKYRCVNETIATMNRNDYRLRKGFDPRPKFRFTNR